MIWKVAGFGTVKHLQNNNNQSDAEYDMEALN